jgi:peptidylprolyl isomerase|tara:strand:- start:951 stop:1388 length:438 start_codon:yes stop_codon:yes gene_type:complete
MTKLKTGDKVKVHYTGTLEDGTTFDNSRDRGENGLEFVIDDGNLLIGFNDAVKNLSVGEKTKVAIKSEKAYGKYMEEAVITVPKTDFPEDMEFQLEGFVQGKDGQDRPVQGQIVKINEEDIDLNMNHPLAGEDLNFEIELLEVVN